MTGRPAFVALGALAGVLTCLIALELVGGGASEDGGIVAVRHAPPKRAATVAAEAADRTDAWVATSLARPLFSRDRKPTPVAAKSDGGPAISSLPRLSGVLVSPFGRLAIFAASEGGKPIVVAAGGTLGPYTVTEIEPGTVTVSGPDGEQNLVLKFDPAARQAALEQMQQAQAQQQAQQQQLAAQQQQAAQAQAQALQAAQAAQAQALAAGQAQGQVVPQITPVVPVPGQFPIPQFGNRRGLPGVFNPRQVPPDPNSPSEHDR